MSEDTNWQNVAQAAPGESDDIGTDDAPMSDPNDDSGVTDEDIDMFEDDPNIPTE
ncbi:hypothetical protein [Stutzerimonas azotifigens]|uniref:Uncharacterized protein n=1 Tax=Stutzerimonas azotifigens TaxID=291995 RepID=A0ABR5Z0U0_9GAMM|nr:hypothetical protein [Stutzerimonas azotifigens]MBA1273818.1 hypothetical protein [Stutzerimonas azotifigens]